MKRLVGTSTSGSVTSFVVKRRVADVVVSDTTMWKAMVSVSLLPGAPEH